MSSNFLEEYFASDTPREDHVWIASMLRYASGRRLQVYDSIFITYTLESITHRETQSGICTDVSVTALIDVGGYTSTVDMKKYIVKSDLGLDLRKYPDYVVRNIFEYVLGSTFLEKLVCDQGTLQCLKPITEYLIEKSFGEDGEDKYWSMESIEPVLKVLMNQGHLEEMKDKHVAGQIMDMLLERIRTSRFIFEPDHFYSDDPDYILLSNMPSKKKVYNMDGMLPGPFEGQGMAVNKKTGISEPHVYERYKLAHQLSK